MSYLQNTKPKLALLSNSYISRSEKIEPFIIYNSLGSTGLTILEQRYKFPTILTMALLCNYIGTNLSISDRSHLLSLAYRGRNEGNENQEGLKMLKLIFSRNIQIEYKSVESFKSIFEEFLIFDFEYRRSRLLDNFLLYLCLLNEEELILWASEINDFIKEPLKGHERKQEFIEVLLGFIELADFLTAFEKLLSTTKNKLLRSCLMHLYYELTAISKRIVAFSQFYSIVHKLAKDYDNYFAETPESDFTRLHEVRRYKKIIYVHQSLKAMQEIEKYFDENFFLQKVIGDLELPHNKKLIITTEDAWVTDSNYRFETITFDH